MQLQISLFDEEEQRIAEEKRHRDDRLRAEKRQLQQLQQEVKYEVAPSPDELRTYYPHISWSHLILRITFFLVINASCMKHFTTIQFVLLTTMHWHI